MPHNHRMQPIGDNYRPLPRLRKQLINYASTVFRPADDPDTDESMYGGWADSTISKARQGDRLSQRHLGDAVSGRHDNYSELMAERADANEMRRWESAYKTGGRSGY